MGNSWENGVEKVWYYLKDHPTKKATGSRLTPQHLYEMDKCGFIRGTSIQLPLRSSFVFFPTASGPKEPFDS
jgi:hypothetical protein